jgi:cytochrome P450
VTTDRATQDLASAVLDDQMLVNPYPVYQRLLDVPGWEAPSGYVVFARYDDVMDVLRDPATFSQEQLHYPNFHVTDPPDHTRVRRLVARAFTPRAVKQQHDQIRAWVGELIDEIADHEHLDFVESFARRLPATVTADMLGVPLSDASQWHQWMKDVHSLRGKIRFDVDSATDKRDQDEAASAAAAMAAYFSGLIADRKRGVRREDLVTDLLDAREADDRLSDEEVFYTLVLLLGAGLETTANQLGNTLRAISERPGLWATLHRDPSLVSGAIEEVLRYDGTLQAEYRIAKVDATVGNTAVKAGQHIIILNAAANRDAAVFPDPDLFDINRSNASQHLTFGWGIHRCLGAQLARAELVIAFEELATRFADVELNGPPVLHAFNRLRGHDHLPIRWAS